jgi:hypothetical protein
MHANVQPIAQSLHACRNMHACMHAVAVYILFQFLRLQLPDRAAQSMQQLSNGGCIVPNPDLVGHLACHPFCVPTLGLVCAMGSHAVANSALQCTVQLYMYPVR